MKTKTKQQIPTTDITTLEDKERLVRCGALSHHPGRAGINAPVEMTYEEAMAKKERGELTESVLTDQGWVTAV